MSEDEQFEVEKVIGERIDEKEGKQFLLKWKGYDEPTWTSEKECDCPELIENFQLRQELEMIRAKADSQSLKKEEVIQAKSAEPLSDTKKENAQKKDLFVTEKPLTLLNTTPQKGSLQSAFEESTPSPKEALFVSTPKNIGSEEKPKAVAPSLPFLKKKEEMADEKKASSATKGKSASKTSSVLKGPPKRVEKQGEKEKLTHHFAAAPAVVSPVEEKKSESAKKRVQFDDVADKKELPLEKKPKIATEDSNENHIQLLEEQIQTMKQHLNIMFSQLQACGRLIHLQNEQLASLRKK